MIVALGERSSRVGSVECNDGAYVFISPHVDEENVFFTSFIFLSNKYEPKPQMFFMW